MNTTTQIALITISSLSLITSAATLTIMVVGGRKMKTEVEEVKTKANRSITNLKSALEHLEL